MPYSKSLLLVILISLFSGNVFSQQIDIYSSEPKTYTIRSLRVTGDNYLSSTTIISLTGLGKGQSVNLPGDDITQAINKLWKERLFSDIYITLDKAENDSIDLTIHVETRPRLSRYTFNGISKSKAKKLKEDLGLQTLDILTEQYLSNLSYKIRNNYKEKGYPNCEVVFEQKQDTLFRNNSVVLFITINKGEKVRIGEIIIDGNGENLESLASNSTSKKTLKKQKAAFSDSKLKKKLKNTKQHQKLNFFRNSKFEKDKFEEDKQALVAYYQEKGFKDMQIVEDSIYKISDSRLGIYIKVEEGRKYYYRDIVWSGNSKHDTKKLEAILGIKKGDIYNPAILQQNLLQSPVGLDVSSLYLDDGYLFFNANPVEVRVDGDSVDMEIRIFEGPQAIISGISVKGNSTTHDHVILREIRTRPGDKFSRSDIIRTQRELATLGFFDEQKMNVNPIPNPEDGTVHIEYILEEKPSDQLELSFGAGGGFIVGILGIGLNNFSTRLLTKPKEWNGYPRGDGQKLSIRGQSNGPQFQSINASFTEPWLGGKSPTSLTVSMFYSAQRFGNLLDQSQRQQLLTPGGSIAIGKRLKVPDNNFVMQHALSYQHYILQNFPLTGQFSTGIANNLNFRHSLIRRTTNDNVYPTDGGTFTASVQWTPPITTLTRTDFENLSLQDKNRWIEYHKWKFDGAYYIGLGRAKKFVLATGVNFGIIGNFNRALGTSTFERFFVGGDGLNNFALDGRELVRLRGYADDRAVTPQVTDLNGNTLQSGGTAYNKFTLELRYPVVNSQALKAFLLGFVEGGNAFSSPSEFNAFDMKRSYGAGVRVFLPMFGLLGVDYGVGIDDPLIPTNKKGHLHIYLGQNIF
jgi:outer membrane protein insertion porin family